MGYDFIHPTGRKTGSGQRRPLWGAVPVQEQPVSRFNLKERNLYESVRGNAKSVSRSFFEIALRGSFFQSDQVISGGSR